MSASTPTLLTCDRASSSHRAASVARDSIEARRRARRFMWWAARNKGYGIGTRSHAVTLLAAVCLIGVVAGCHAPGRGPSGDSARSTGTSPVASEDTLATGANDGVGETPEGHPDRWLVVKKVAKAGKGSWAKGEFDAGRNKIGVVTENVDEFTIDTGRIPINWDRVVIISIDGINAELRPRDYSLLLFRRAGLSSWSVVEP